MSYIPTEQYLVSSLWIRYGLTPRYQNLCSVNGTLQKTSIFLLYHIVSIWSCCKFTLSQIRCWVALISNDHRRNTYNVHNWFGLQAYHAFFSPQTFVFLCISMHVSVFLIFPGQPRKPTFQLHSSDHQVEKEAVLPF